MSLSFLARDGRSAFTQPHLFFSLAEKMELTARIKSFLHLQNFCLRRCSFFPVSGCRDPFIWRRKRESKKKRTSSYPEGPEGKPTRFYKLRREGSSENKESESKSGEGRERRWMVLRGIQRKLFWLRCLFVPALLRFPRSACAWLTLQCK